LNWAVRNAPDVIVRVGTMSFGTTTETIPLKADRDGILRVGRTRVTLDTVIRAFMEGATAEEIGQQYPTLNLADVYYVIGYYLQHRDDVEAYLGKRREAEDKVRGENEARFDPHGVRDRLLARRRAAV